MLLPPLNDRNPDIAYPTFNKSLTPNLSAIRVSDRSALVRGTLGKLEQITGTFPEKPRVAPVVDLGDEPSAPDNTPHHFVVRWFVGAGCEGTGVKG